MGCILDELNIDIQKDNQKTISVIKIIFLANTYISIILLLVVDNVNKKVTYGVCTYII